MDGFLSTHGGRHPLDNSLKTFIRDFLQHRGYPPERTHVESLRGDGSKRRFWRISMPENEARFIVMSNTPSGPYNRAENDAYVQIGRHLRAKGAPLPEIYLFDAEKGWVVMEDMGRTSLQEAVAEGRALIPLYRRVILLLLTLQLRGAEDFDVRWCCQTTHYDRTVMLRYEADYFRDVFLGTYMGNAGQGSGLQLSFDHLANTASRADGRFFLYRDFQSRNILIDGGHIGFIDWQGGRLGPLGYDLASLLIDPYTDLSSEVQEEIFRYYLLSLRSRDADLAEDLERSYPYLALQRNLQILGAFANLSRIQGKTYFEDYIPAALKGLCVRLRRLEDRELDPLRELAEGLIEGGR